MTSFESNFAAAYQAALRRTTPGMKVFTKCHLLHLPAVGLQDVARELRVQWWFHGRCKAEWNFLFN